MKNFSYETAINQLKLDKEPLNKALNYEKIPEWVRGKDFINCFLPYVKVIGDSREQDKWVEQACAYYGIAFEWAKKDKQSNTENLKEGDYTLKVIYGAREFDYTGVVAYERKGSIGELYGNCTAKKATLSDRDRITREFDRFKEKGYKKVVLMLEFGEKLTDLIDMSFSYYKAGGLRETKNIYYTIYSAIMSWKQPNNKNFDVIQSNSHSRLFWLFLQDFYYYFRNELRLECVRENLFEKEQE